MKVQAFIKVTYVYVPKKLIEIFDVCCIYVYCRCFRNKIFKSSSFILFVQESFNLEDYRSLNFQEPANVI